MEAAPAPSTPGKATIQREPGGDGHREPRQGQTHIKILMDKQTSKAESSAVTNPTDTGNTEDTRCPPAPRAQRSGFSLLRLKPPRPRGSRISAGRDTRGHASEATNRAPQGAHGVDQSRASPAPGSCERASRHPREALPARRGGINGVCLAEAGEGRGRAGSTALCSRSGEQLLRSEGEAAEAGCLSKRFCVQHQNQTVCGTETKASRQHPLAAQGALL